MDYQVGLNENKWQRTNPRQNVCNLSLIFLLLQTVLIYSVRSLLKRRVATLASTKENYLLWQSLLNRKSDIFSHKNHLSKNQKKLHVFVISLGPLSFAYHCAR